MKIKYLIAIITSGFNLLSNIYITSAQTKSNTPGLIQNIKSLKVGDKVPEIPIAKIVNNGLRSAKISDFKHQLLILDFWDTGCGSCIELLPKLSMLQQAFGDKIKILPVSWQKEEVIEKFFNSNRFIKQQKPTVQLPCVVEDVLLRSYFKHQIISHEVWIYKGTVIAITSPEYISAKNIQMVLDGNKVSWPVKEDAVDFDIKTPLIEWNSEQKVAKSQLVNYSVLTREINGLNKTGGINFKFDSLNHTSSISMFNKSIVGMYQLLLKNVDTISGNFLITPGRRVLEVKNPSKYEYNPSEGLYDQWKRKNEFCYELFSDKSISKYNLTKHALRDLDNKLGLHGRWEKRSVKCLVIVNSGKVNVDAIATGNTGQSISMISFGLEYSGNYPPVIDETGYKGKINLGSYDGSLKGLKEQLQKHGFDIITEHRKIDVMVITEV